MQDAIENVVIDAGTLQSGHTVANEPPLPVGLVPVGQLVSVTRVAVICLLLMLLLLASDLATMPLVEALM